MKSDRSLRGSKSANVTPRAGVWIEIIKPGAAGNLSESLPVRECGLKFDNPQDHGYPGEPSLPVRECGLKFDNPQDHGYPGEPSLPVRECGLKYIDRIERARQTLSLPVRECGLKSYFPACYMSICSSLPVRECGLKFPVLPIGQLLYCHSPCGSVD